MVKDVIRYHRKRLGLSQKELAEILGIPKPTLVSYECGKRFPALHHAILLADYFGCDIHDLDRR